MNIMIIGMNTQPNQENQNLNGLTYAPNQTSILLKTSSSTVVSIVYALNQRQYDFALCNAVVLFTSVNY